MSSKESKQLNWGSSANSSFTSFSISHASLVTLSTTILHRPGEEMTFGCEFTTQRLVSNSRPWCDVECIIAFLQLYSMTRPPHCGTVIRTLLSSSFHTLHTATVVLNPKGQGRIKSAFRARSCFSSLPARNTWTFWKAINLDFNCLMFPHTDRHTRARHTQPFCALASTQKKRTRQRTIT